MAALLSRRGREEAAADPAGPNAVLSRAAADGRAGRAPVIVPSLASSGAGVNMSAFRGRYRQLFTPRPPAMPSFCRSGSDLTPTPASIKARTAGASPPATCNARRPASCRSCSHQCLALCSATSECSRSANAALSSEVLCLKKSSKEPAGAWSCEHQQKRVKGPRLKWQLLLLRTDEPSAKSGK